jgi:hypothetical protein
MISLNNRDTTGKRIRGLVSGIILHSQFSKKVKVKLKYVHFRQV